MSILYSTKLPSTGGLRPYTWSIISGSLPPEVTLNSATGVISGTPTSAGTYDFSAQVSDGQSPPDTDVKDLSIVVTPAPSPLLKIKRARLPDGKLEDTYIHTLEATGGVAPYTWSLAAGRLPSQLTLDRTTGAIRVGRTKRAH